MKHKALNESKMTTGRPTAVYKRYDRKRTSTTRETNDDEEEKSEIAHKGFKAKDSISPNQNRDKSQIKSTIIKDAMDNEDRENKIKLHSLKTPQADGKEDRQMKLLAELF